LLEKTVSENRKPRQRFNQRGSKRVTI